MTEQRLELLEHLRRKRRRSRDAEPECAANLASRRPFDFQQPHVHRRHAEEDRGTEVAQGRGGGGMVEAFEQPRAATRQQPAVDAVAEPVDVEERERQQETIVGGEAPRVDQHRRVGAEVAVRDHGAFGRPGRARRVDERGRRSRVEDRVDWRDARDAEAACASASIPHAGGSRTTPRRVIGDDHRLRRRVAEDVTHLAVAIQDVDRDDDHAKPRAGQEQIDVLDAVGQIDRQPIARAETSGRELVRHPGGAPVEVCEGVLLARPLERDGVGRGLRRWGRTGRGGLSAECRVPSAGCGAGCRSAGVPECSMH